MPKKRKNKLRQKSFIISLGVISALGFISLLLSDAFSIDISSTVENLIFMALGVGLIFLGGISNVTKFPIGGLDMRETMSIVTIFVGLLAILGGILSFSPETLIPLAALMWLRIIVSALAIVIITFQVLGVIVK